MQIGTPAESIHASRPPQVPRLSENPQVRVALDWFAPNISWINDEQARLTGIPAPPFQEAVRAAAVKESLKWLELLLALVIVVCIVAITALGSNSNATFTNVSTTLGS